MLKGGVIMDVTNAEEARIAEEAGAVAVMALERVPADIRKNGGVARMSDPEMIKAIKKAVTIPVMAKARIGHFVEAQILEALGVDYIDESEVGSKGLGAAVPCVWPEVCLWFEVFWCQPHPQTSHALPLQVLTPADEIHHINKHNYKVPFVCGCRDLGEALRRIAEGAAMIRTKVGIDTSPGGAAGMMLCSTTCRRCCSLDSDAGTSAVPLDQSYNLCRCWYICAAATHHRP
jgi:pyridoxal 5'-phosphate synthase pdxS subunit